ncbi:hypothetical protein CKA32_005569 [Geitlerinema sp. FC II]|nr:hypothetical protein CKA32_005569 [Geitlerinema sp. FC II]
MFAIQNSPSGYGEFFLGWSYAVVGQETRFFVPLFGLK